MFGSTAVDLCNKLYNFYSIEKTKTFWTYAYITQKRIIFQIIATCYKLSRRQSFKTIIYEAI